MLRIALQPKFLGILALMVAATVVCGLLASWQWSRANEAREMTVTVDTAASVPIDTLLGEGEPVTNEIQGRLVSLTGTFDPSKQVLSPGRSIDGADAAIVITDFVITSGPLTGVHLPIARGWIPEAELETAAVPAPPAGETALVVRLEAAEGASNTIAGGPESSPSADATPEPIAATLPQVATISSPYLINVWGGPMLAAYGAITDDAVAEMNAAGVGQDGAGPDAASPDGAGPDGAGGLRTLPAAESHFSQGLNLQNFGYMLQWILFGVFFLYIWWRMVRTEYLEQEQERRLRIDEALAGARGTGAPGPRSSDPGAPGPRAPDPRGSDPAA